MKSKALLFSAITACAIATPTIAMAQSSDVLVIRRSIAKPLVAKDSPAPPTSSGVTCGDFQRKRTANGLEVIHLYAGPKGLLDSDFEVARDTCESWDTQPTVCVVNTTLANTCRANGISISSKQDCKAVRIPDSASASIIGSSSDNIAATTCSPS